MRITDTLIVSSIIMSLTAAGSARSQRPSPPLMQYRNPPTVDITRKWGSPTVEQRVVAAGFDNPYVLCRIGVNERSRRPRSQKPEDGDAGYRLIEASRSRVVWQAWVMSANTFFGPRNWLLADFSTSWIRDDATAAEKKRNNCMDRSPISMPPRDMPDSGSAPGGNDYKYRVLRRLVCTEGRGEFVGDDVEQTSNISCADADNVLQNSLRKKDQCEFEGNNRYPGRSMVRSIRIATSECR